jgi:hypothetical protein
MAHMVALDAGTRAATITGMVDREHAADLGVCAFGITLWVFITVSLDDLLDVALAGLRNSVTPRHPGGAFLFLAV